MHIKLFIVSFVSILLLTGCQNHIRNMDVTTQDYERSIISDTFILKPVEQDREQGKISLQVYENKTTQVQLYTNQRTDRQSTPYQLWRELYELPFGVVTLSLGMVTHALNIVTLGFVPYRWAWNLDCVGMSALNPCLNIEDENRIVNETLKNSRELADQKEENEEILKVNYDVMASVDDEKIIQKTDSQGIVNFSLLNFDGTTLFPNLEGQQIQLSTGPLGKQGIYSWIISRQTIRRLKMASKVISQYHQNPSGIKLAETEKLLETYGFNDVAFLFKKSELKKRGMNKAFRKDYMNASAEN